VPGIAEWWDGGRRERAGGHEVFVRVEGPEDGRWVTLLHGFPTCSYDWEPISAALTAAGHRLLLFDFLGFGDSDKPRVRYSYFDQLAILRDLWEAHGVERTAVVAHDYGVSAAQELLAAHDPRVERVAFLNGGMFADLHRPLRVQKLLRTPVVGAIVARAMNERSLTGNFRAIFSDEHPPTDAEMHEHWLGIERRGGQRNTHRLIRYIDERFEHAERWAGAIDHAEVPLAFVWGNSDPISGKHMLDGARQRAPGAHFASRDDIGHYPQLEDPDWVAGELVAFLAG
jgi:pimeloyl-ACP methyl ester carboxylesterase